MSTLLKNNECDLFWICSFLMGEKKIFQSKQIEKLFSEGLQVLYTFYLPRQLHSIFHTKLMLDITGLSLAILNVFSSLSGKASFLTFLSCAGSSSALLH